MISSVHSIIAGSSVLTFVALVESSQAHELCAQHDHRPILVNLLAAAAAGNMLRAPQQSSCM
jgi:hypothetical protein